MFSKNKLLILILFFTGQQVYSQGIFVAKQFISSRNDTLRYRELLPENYIPQEKYPLVLFLHGSGERGSDNQAQMIHGSMMFTNPVNLEKYPAIVLFPQCPKNNFWAFEKRPEGKFDADAFPANYTIASIMQTIKDLLDEYIANGDVDTNRIYVMGLSMGGMGTFDLVCRFPDIFAAAIPICGGVNTGRLKVAAGKVKFRIYHGDKDDTVPVENSRKAYRALKESGAEVEYFEIAGCNHASWDPSFNQPDFLQWLFQQSKIDIYEE
jgi:predicted peptidase